MSNSIALDRLEVALLRLWAEFGPMLVDAGETELPITESIRLKVLVVGPADLRPLSTKERRIFAAIADAGHPLTGKELQSAMRRQMPGERCWSLSTIFKTAADLVHAGYLAQDRDGQGYALTEKAIAAVRNSDG